jgi:hypothetical protein
VARRAVGLEVCGVLVAALVVMPLCACDLPPDRAAERGPAVVSSSPADGDVDVPRLGPFVVRFDRRLLPRTVSRATVRLESGVVAILLSVRYDVLTQSVIAVPLDGRPIDELVAWRLTVDGVGDLDGRPMDAPYVARFRTGVDEGPGLVEPPPATFADVASIFTARCTGSACHGPGPAALGLDLSSASGVRDTAVNQPARSFPPDTLGPSGGAGAPVFAGLPLIEVIAGVGRPETSYLLYTALGDPHVVGAPMPPALRDDPSAGLSPDELDALSSWIRAGAATP